MLIIIYQFFFILLFFIENIFNSIFIKDYFVVHCSLLITNLMGIVKKNSIVLFFNNIKIAI